LTRYEYLTLGNDVQCCISTFEGTNISLPAATD